MTLKQSKMHPDFCKAYVFLTMLFFLVSNLFQWYSPERGSALTQNITYPILLMCIGVIAAKGGYRQHPVLKLAVAFIVWYAITRVLNGNNYLMRGRYGLAINIGCWLVALPFGFSLSGKQKVVAPNMLVAITVAFVSLLSWLSLYAVLANNPIQLPFTSFPIGINGEFRLSALGKHPNLLGCLFGVSILLTVFITSQWKSRALAVMVNLLLGFSFYCTLALTDSRTSIVLTAVFTSCAIGVTVAPNLAIQKHFLKNIVLASLIFVCSIVLYLGNDVVKNTVNANIRSTASPVQTTGIQYAGENALIPTSYAQADPSVQNPRVIMLATAASSDVAPTNQTASFAPAQITDRSLLENAATLNGRLGIYKAVLRAMWDRPVSIVIGADEAKFADAASKYLPAGYAHAHNSLLQLFSLTGLIGLILALMLLAYAAGCGITVFRCHQSTVSDKVLVLIPAMIFLHAMMEGYLFLTDDTLNLLFFLLVGLVVKRAQDCKDGHPAPSL